MQNERPAAAVVVAAVANRATAARRAAAHGSRQGLCAVRERAQYVFGHNLKIYFELTNERTRKKLPCDGVGNADGASPRRLNAHRTPQTPRSLNMRLIVSMNMRLIVSQQARRATAVVPVKPALDGNERRLSRHDLILDAQVDHLATHDARSRRDGLELPLRRSVLVNSNKNNISFKVSNLFCCHRHIERLFLRYLWSDDFR